jgi:hypothetical protein
VAARSASDRTHKQNSAKDTVSPTVVPEDARWDAERQAVEFGVENIVERNLHRRQLTEDGGS